MGALADFAGPVLLRVRTFVDTLQRLRLQLPSDDDEIYRGTSFGLILGPLLVEGIELLRWSEKEYEKSFEVDPATSSVDTLGDIGELISHEVAGQEITDVLYLARSELRGALEDLEVARQSGDPFRSLSSCESGLRTIKRCLIAVESSLCEYEGVDPPIRQWADLEVSLRTRRLYGELRRQLRGTEPTPDEVADRLAFVASQLDSIRELDIYPLLRFDDRVAMKDLRRRLRELPDRDEVDPAAGVRIWQDVVGIAELLKEVNHRQELRQHDRNVVRRTYHRFFGRATRPVAISEDQLFQARALLGLDDELDELVLAGPTGDLEKWHQVLERLLRGLTHMPMPDTPNVEFPSE